MEFRRSGSADERRRRVMRDEITGQGEEGAEAPATVPLTTKRPSKRRYSSGALAENQPRITDFVPQRGFTLLLWGLGLLTAIAGLQAAFISLGTNGWLVREPRLEVFDLARPGNIGQWLAGGMFALTAMHAFVIYRLRAHRVDDFRGRYRLWGLALAAAVLASIDVTTGMHHACGATTEILAGRTFLGMRDGWWLVIYALVFGSLGIRMGIEVRASRGALVLLASSPLFFGIAALLTTGIVTRADALERTVIYSTAWLLGVWSVVMGTATFARHVYLDAQGLLPVETGTKRRKKKSRSAKASSDSDEEAEDTDEETIHKEAAARANSGKTAAAATSRDEDEDEDDAGGDRSLSKSERKRLKKMQQTTRRAA